MSPIGLFARGVGRRWGAARSDESGGLAAARDAALVRLRGLARRAVTGSTVRQAERIEARWQAMRELAASVDLFIAPSRYLAAELIGFGVPAEKMRCSDYGFSARRFPPRSPLPDRARRFGFIGSLVPHKGVHNLIEAFCGMPSEAELLICGSPGDDPAYAARLRDEARHPGVTFVGRLMPERVPEFLQGLDCLVAPSIWQENSPLCIHEAFLTGVPVVASRVGGQAELLADGGGWLYDVDDSAALRSLLSRLHKEPGLLREIAATIPPVKSLDEHVVELESVYLDLCTRVSE